MAGLASAAPAISFFGLHGPATRVNIQNDKGKAKPYQVRQVVKAIAKLEGME